MGKKKAKGEIQYKKLFVEHFGREKNYSKKSNLKKRRRRKKNKLIVHSVHEEKAKT